MMKKLYLLATAVSAFGQQQMDTDTSVTLSNVKCNGKDQMKVDFTVDFNRDEDIMDSMIIGEYQCKYNDDLNEHDSFTQTLTNDDSANGMRSYHVQFNPYQCVDDPDSPVTRTTFADFSVQVTVRLHTQVVFGSGASRQEFITSALDFTAGCEFQNIYDITSEPMTLEETQIDVTYDTFATTAADFNLDMDPKNNVMANAEVTASFTVNAGSPFSELSANIGYAPTRCVIKTTHDAEDEGFLLYDVNDAAASCGFTQLLFSIHETTYGDDAPREWTMKYIAFIMDDKVNGGRYTGLYTLECTIDVCMENNITDETHNCYAAIGCFD